ncbi:hypothetical protein AX774_g5285 [Zancudomyces culisetae]|uniref:Uncharacterized protein n=1 Tax=Zancudomyces culisetae TaxID=1213189 RepID=A0A1R1PJW8_ZANCU|nr:hypothetical protein AX774_g5285 [Zancudomyces culisetae]|eukprot:OMH81270.1 hypothetical protein AX774_g5285 [Zancudomyces culisetae]
MAARRTASVTSFFKHPTVSRIYSFAFTPSGIVYSNTNPPAKSYCFFAKSLSCVLTTCLGGEVLFEKGSVGGEQPVPVVVATFEISWNAPSPPTLNSSTPVSWIGMNTVLYVFCRSPIGVTKLAV